MNAGKKLIVLIDLNGTLHVGNTATHRAVDALQLLRQNSNKISFKFVTNTTKESLIKLHARLLRCGFNDVKPAEIFSSLSAAKVIIERRNLRPFLFLEEEAMDDFKDIPIKNPNAVVVGLAPTKFNFEHLNSAFKILLNSDTAPLVAINKGRYYQTESDGLCLGPGPFVECLEYATGRKAEIVGKPQGEFYRQAIQQLVAENENAFSEQLDALPSFFMIGDDVRDDVIGAIEAGGQGILVRTGKYRKGDENEVEPEKRICVENFYGAIQFLLSRLS